MSHKAKSDVEIFSFVFLLCLLCACGLPSDDALHEKFVKHEAEFQKLSKMVSEDKRVTRVADDFTWLESTVQWPRPEGELGFSRARWDEYRDLFRKLGLREGFYRPEIDGQRRITFFPSSSLGLTTGGAEKGYAFTESRPEPIRESLDGLGTSPPSLKPVFKKLKDNWYLYYMWDD